MKTLEVSDEAFRALFHVHEVSVDDLRRPAQVRSQLTSYVQLLRRALAGEHVGDLVEQFAEMPAPTPPMDLVERAQRSRRIYEERLSALDVGIIRACNLRCRACAAAAPLMRSAGACTPAELNRTLRRFAELAGPRHMPDVVNLLGGEPTIHPQFLDVVRAARAAMPDVHLRVVTNGHALVDAHDEVFEVLADLGVDLNVSIYGPGSFFFMTKFTKGTPTLTCSACINHTPIFLKGRSYIEVCPAALMPNGDLCFCGNVPMAMAVAERFDIPLRIERGLTGDVVNIHDVDSFEDVLRFMRRETTPMARYCSLPEVIPWGVSTRSPSEWLDETWGCSHADQR